jgi:hypothetical protein
MPFYSLPCIVESQFAAYISANYSGAYSVFQAFNNTAFTVPCIIVKAGRFKEVEPFTGVYEGTLAVMVETQADDSTLEEHDLTLGTVFQLMNTPSALIPAVNTSGDNFQLWSYYNSGYDQERDERCFKTILEYTINCQNASLT